MCKWQPIPIRQIVLSVQCGADTNLGNNSIDIHVAANNHRLVPTQLQSNSFKRLCTTSHDLLPRVDRPSGTDFINLGTLRHHRTKGIIATQMPAPPPEGRNPSQFGQLQTGAWRVRRRLEDDYITSVHCSDYPARRKRDRIIPRCNGADNA